MTRKEIRTELMYCIESYETRWGAARRLIVPGKQSFDRRLRSADFFIRNCGVCFPVELHPHFIHADEPEISNDRKAELQKMSEDIPPHTYQ